MVDRPNQVWSTDITYIRLARGFAYLVAIIDWYSRRVLSWRISNSMEATFCVACLEDALRLFGTPEVFNTDQGSQFTSGAFTGVLKREGIAISMDGRGRAFYNIFVERLWRNVKHEDVYLNGYASMGDLLMGLSKYFTCLQRRSPSPAKTASIALRSTEGTFDEEGTSSLNTKTKNRAAPFSCMSNRVQLKPRAKIVLTHGSTLTVKPFCLRQSSQACEQAQCKKNPSKHLD